MDAVSRKLVYDRAGGRCEYCRLPQTVAPYLRFHVEHIVAQQHMLDDSLDNLALSCPDCNRRKGPNLTTIEWEMERWYDYFIPAATAGKSISKCTGQ